MPATSRIAATSAAGILIPPHPKAAPCVRIVIFSSSWRSLPARQPVRPLSLAEGGGRVIQDQGRLPWCAMPQTNRVPVTCNVTGTRDSGLPTDGCSLESGTYLTTTSGLTLDWPATVRRA